MSRRDIVGLLMANGRSSRMGTDKRLLPWSPALNRSDSATPTLPTARTVIAAAFDAVAPSCDEIFVAAEPSPAVRTALGARAYRFVAGDSGTDLGASIAVALRALLALRSDAAPGALILHLADHPAVRPETVATLVAAWKSTPDAIVSPTLSPTLEDASLPPRRSTSGHPIVVPGEMLPKILDHLNTSPPPVDGLRGFMRDPTTVRHRVSVDDLGIVIDLDSPEQYDAATKPTMRSGVPDARDDDRGSDGA